MKDNSSFQVGRKNKSAYRYLLGIPYSIILSLLHHPVDSLHNQGFIENKHWILQKRPKNWLTFLSINQRVGGTTKAILSRSYTMNIAPSGRRCNTS